MQRARVFYFKKFEDKMKWKPVIMYACPNCDNLSDIQDKFCHKCDEPVGYSGIYKPIKAQTIGQAEEIDMPNERELTEYYNNEETQEWLNAPLGKQKASGAVAGQWQKEKPTKPCLFVHRYNEKDDKPGLQYAVMDCDILCVTDIELNEFVSTMDNFADGEFFIIHFI